MQGVDWEVAEVALLGESGGQIEKEREKTIRGALLVVTLWTFGAQSHCRT